MDNNLDEVLSRSSLDKAPWVRARIKELGLKGKPPCRWLPPTFSIRDQGRAAVRCA